MVRFLLPVFAAAGDESVLISVSAPRKSSISVSDSTGETVLTGIDEADGGGEEGRVPPELSQSRGLGVTFGEGSGFVVFSKYQWNLSFAFLFSSSLILSKGFE